MSIGLVALLGSAIVLWRLFVLFQIGNAQPSPDPATVRYPISRIIVPVYEGKGRPQFDPISIQPYSGKDVLGVDSYWGEMHQIELWQGSPYFELLNSVKPGDAFILKITDMISKQLQVVERVTLTCPRAMEQCKNGKWIRIVVRDRDVARYA
jgi:hypothetical protein